MSTQDRQTIELGLALPCNDLSTHCGPEWMPRGVLLCHGRPLRLDSHWRCFGRTVSFNQDRNALWLDAACLRTPVAVGSDPAHSMLTPMLVSRVDDAHAVAVKVEGVMGALLPFSSCNRKNVAQLANLSERSLQRRLAEAGTSFQQLRPGARRHCAEVPAPVQSSGGTDRRDSGLFRTGRIHARFPTAAWHHATPGTVSCRSKRMIARVQLEDQS